MNMIPSVRAGYVSRSMPTKSTGVVLPDLTPVSLFVALPAALDWGMVTLAIPPS
jgi:hypothetical protein